MTTYVLVPGFWLGGWAWRSVADRGVLVAGDMLSDLFVPKDRAYVYALRDERVPDDPRVGAARPGWEWVSDIHEGQVQSLARKRADG